ncbi:hypothetical protein AB1Y20_007464 [Prymnesium parvum]|uniref:Uncharacterized protein n=1 Tax=Prymnesium parvum TaxID=97485 RepID=A0AB34IV33_PRYPA
MAQPPQLPAWPVFPPPALPSCVCADTWNTTDSPQCEETQYGCAWPACDGDDYAWCLVANAPCEGAFSPDDEPWIYCQSPPSSPPPPSVSSPPALPSCVCADTWSTTDSPQCEETQYGCAWPACDGDDYAWCLVANAPCEGAFSPDDEPWIYCQSPPSSPPPPSVSSPPALPSCVCADTWNTTDSPQCEETQYGCAWPACDGDDYAWCLVATAPCEGAFSPDDEPWIYCQSPPSSPPPPSVSSPPALPSCVCADTWSTTDSPQCEETQYGCAWPACDGDDYAWCLVANAPCEGAFSPDDEPWIYCQSPPSSPPPPSVSSPPALPSCVCADTWSTTDSPQCEETQYGCAWPACDGDDYAWCLVANAPCEGAFSPDDEPWIYCQSPPSSPPPPSVSSPPALPSCVCADTWSTTDSPQCEETQYGCAWPACDGDDYAWCLVANAPCEGAFSPDDEPWIYCQSPPSSPPPPSVSSPPALPSCVCADTWSTTDSPQCEETQYGCAWPACDGDDYAWCLVANAPCEGAFSPDDEPWIYCQSPPSSPPPPSVSSPPALPSCVCADTWSTTDSPQCEETQYGCAWPACDGDDYAWCLVANAPCEGAFSPDDEPWIYSQSPPSSPPPPSVSSPPALPSCVCADVLSTTDSPQCEETQYGCAWPACDGDDYAWDTPTAICAPASSLRV